MTRNSHGLKDSIDMYRTFNGHHYIAWLSCPSEDRIAAYRIAGVRCKRRGDELFIHHMDRDDASAVDAKIER